MRSKKTTKASKAAPKKTRAKRNIKSANGKLSMDMYHRQVHGGGIMPSVPGLNYRDTQYRTDGGVKNSARFVVNMAVDGRVKVWSWSIPVHGPVESLRNACKHLVVMRKKQYNRFPYKADELMEKAVEDFLNAGRRGYSKSTMSKEFQETRKALANYAKGK